MGCQVIGNLGGDAVQSVDASMLIFEGVDVVTISKRLGHAKPGVTLIYAHLFSLDLMRVIFAKQVQLGLGPIAELGSSQAVETTA